MTCLADWAAMRPKSKGGSVSAMASPTWAAGLRLRASESGISSRVVLDLVVLDDEEMAGQPQLAGLRMDLGVDVGFGAVARTRGLGDGVLHRGDHDPPVDHLLAGDRIGDLQELEPVGGNGHEVTPP